MQFVYSQILQCNLQKSIKKQSWDEEKKQMEPVGLQEDKIFIIVDSSIIEVGIPLKKLFDTGGVVFMEYTKAAEHIIAYCGGVPNISSVTHCATRLRLFIIDKQRVQLEEIKKMKGVLGTVYSGDELQIVLGKNLIPVYDETVKIFNGGGSEKIEKAPDQSNGKKTPKNVIQTAGGRLIGFVSAAVTPMIPGLVAGGMLKTFLLLITLAYAPFGETQAYTLLSYVADVPFYFMPIFVAYGAAKKLGGTPIFAMVAVAGLVYPNFLTLINGDAAVSIFSITVTPVKYASTLLPALLISACAYYCEKLLVKLLPGIVRPILLGVGTIAITYVLGITVLGPLGYIAGTYVAGVFLWAAENLGPVAVGLLAGCMPFLVMTGMHHAVTPFMVQAISDPGYDPMFRPAYLLHNMAEGGACLGVALRAKKKTVKAECFSLAFGCIVAGVTEPAIYGVNLPLKKPMIGVVAGAASGGFVAGLLGATAYVYGYSTILAIPIFQQTIMAIVIAIIVAITVAAAVTFVLGFNEEDINL